MLLLQRFSVQKQIEDLQKEMKEMAEKEKKRTQLLQMAKKQLEKLRKENQVGDRLGPDSNPVY